MTPGPSEDCHNRGQCTSDTFSVRVGDEVYVYVRGQLVMKRWLRTGVSVTFHVLPAGTRWNVR